MKLIKMNQLKVMSNNPDLFIRLGNLFPTYEDCDRFFSFFTERVQNLLLDIIPQFNLNLFSSYVPRSYLKSISSTIDLLILTDGLSNEDFYDKNHKHYHLTDISLETLGVLIDGKYYNKWKKIIDTYKLTYNPIRPYDMIINDKSKEVTDNTVNIARSNSSTNNESLDVTETNIKETTSSKTNNSVDSSTTTTNENTKSSSNDEMVKDVNTNSLYGFNSVDCVPTDDSFRSSESKSNSDSNNTKEETYDRNFNDNEETSLSDNENNNSKTVGSNQSSSSGNTNTSQAKEFTIDREIERLGNIGNISQQDLIDKERETWSYELIDMIFKDLDKILTSPKYI